MKLNLIQICWILIGSLSLVGTIIMNNVSTWFLGVVIILGSVTIIINQQQLKELRSQTTSNTEKEVKQ